MRLSALTYMIALAGIAACGCAQSADIDFAAALGPEVRRAILVHEPGIPDHAVRLVSVARTGLDYGVVSRPGQHGKAAVYSRARI